MKKVYCVIFNYQGYDDQVQAIYAKEKDAIEQLVAECRECGEDNIVDFMYEGDLSLVEWECGSNRQRVIQPSCDWWG